MVNSKNAGRPSSIIETDLETRRNSSGRTSLINPFHRIHIIRISQARLCTPIYKPKKSRTRRKPTWKQEKLFRAIDTYFEASLFTVYNPYIMDQSPPAPSQMPTPDQEAAVSSQCQRFFDLHPQLAAAKERFQLFYSTVGLKAVQEYLDALDEILHSKEIEKTQFTMRWCSLLNRQIRFKGFTVLLSIKSDEPLKKELSKLAFVIQYPKLSRIPKITLKEMVDAIDNALSLKDEAAYLNPPTSQPNIPLDPVIASVQARFLDIHAELPNAEKSFEKLRRFIKLEGVNDYLSRLAIESDGRTQEEVSQLAFMHQHPDFHQSRQITHEDRVKIIDANSDNKAIALLYRSTIDPIIAEGFNHTYLNSHEIIDPTFDILAQYATSWTSATHLAPYTSLIGPSMCGKTRLLKELSKRVCVVYICIRSLTSSGYPPRSDFATEKLLDSKSTSLEERYQILLISIFYAVSDFFSNQVKNQTPDKRLEQWINYSFPQKNELNDPPFWKQVQTRMIEFDTQNPTISDADLSAEMLQAIDMAAKSTSFTQQTGLRVILAIDEASELLDGPSPTDMSFFRLFRRALKKVPEKNGFFSIFCDTTSRVSNVNPPARHDPSYRPSEAGAVLFPSIYQIPTFDVNVSTPPKTWQQLQSAFRLFRYGSPFWGVYVDDARKKGGSDAAIVGKLVPFALRKLLCMDPGLITSPSELTNPQAIALLGSTVQPQLYGAAPINAELVSSHLAQCMYISESREMLVSEYPSQFTLSSAANSFLARDDAWLIRCISVLTLTRRQGYVTTGDIGEIVSRIILSRAMQETMKKNPQNTDANSDPNSLTMPFGHSVPLVDFLETLTGLKRDKLDLGPIDDKNKTKLLDEGQLFWNHFVSIDFTPTSADLLQQLHRGAAVQCKPNQKGFDQLFTIYLKTQQVVNLMERRITMCGVQVKNRQQTGKLDAKTHHWTPKFAGIDLKERNPYLVLYLSLRGSQKSQEEKNQPEVSPPTSPPPKSESAKTSKQPPPRKTPHLTRPKRSRATTSRVTSQPPQAKKSQVTSLPKKLQPETSNPNLTYLPINDELRKDKESDRRASRLSKHLGSSSKMS
ncbi:hypothetical protein PCASD_08210 [Puccinia coronata f. sp. avenae]|uniref:Uncharacterized protein n=1 Tax=Puccinia coronata f. sp. avenae TaxID=200324 RepID=A0A2N5ULJ6_9BASI|nr:hypothetical protein PCASD_08210 [Puccinia coronata f. sp. avenae]